MKEKKLPKIQSNIPSGEDSFEAGSHKNIANTIITIIEKQSDVIEKQIIGLEGDGGTGKSNIIKILEKNNSQKYLYFTYDTWTHQEDLTRKSILQELIDFLKINSVIKEDDKTWIKKENELSQKIITKNVNIFPKIKFYYILFAISFVLIKFVNEILKQQKGKITTVFYDNSINYLTKNFHLGGYPNWTYILKLAPFLLIFFGIISLIWNIISDIRSNCKLQKKDRLTFFQIIGKSFYWGYGEKLESDSTETVNETEPSNQRFRRFLSDLDEELKKKKKTLIFTIDNSDRLSDEKIKNIWSTINIFFAESNTQKFLNNIWLIVPYDENKIINSFSNGTGQGLLDKTFAITLKVPPPLISNWELFFEERLDISFENIDIEEKDEEIQILKRLFDFYEENITPRKIINFINQITSYYIQNEDIKLRYIAIFVFNKNKLLSGNINENIINREKYLHGISNLFLDDEHLEINLSKIIYGLKSDLKAQESLLLKEIKSVLIGKKELSKVLMNTPSFNSYFSSVFSKYIKENNHANLDINNLFFKTITKTLENVKETFHLKNDQKNYHRIWEDYSKILLSGAFNDFEYTHKKVIENCNANTSKKLTNKTILHSARSISGTNAGDIEKLTKNESEYIKNLINIYDFILANNKFNFEDLRIDEQFISPDNFLLTVKAKPNNYKEFKIFTSAETLKNFFLRISFDTDINIDKIIEYHNELIEIVNDYDLTFLHEPLNNHYKRNIFSSVIELNIVSILSDTLEKKYNSELLRNINLESFKTIVDFIYKNINDSEINLCYSYRLLIRNYDIGKNIIHEFPDIFEFDDKGTLLQINHDINNYQESDLIKILRMSVDLNKNKENVLSFIGRGILNNENYIISNNTYNYFLENFTKIKESIEDEMFNKIIGQINIHFEKFKLDIEKIDSNIINHFESPFNSYLIKESNDFLNNLEITRVKQLFTNPNSQEYKIIDKLSHDTSQLNLTIDIGESLKQFYRVNRLKTNECLNFINRVKSYIEKDKLKIIIKDAISNIATNRNIIYFSPEVLIFLDEFHNMQKNQIIGTLLNEPESYSLEFIDFITNQNNPTWIQILKNHLKSSNVLENIKEYALSKDSLKESQ